MHQCRGCTELEGGDCESGVCFVLMEAVKGKLGFQAERADSVKERRTPCRIVEEGMRCLSGDR